MHARQSGSLAQLTTSSLQLVIMQLRVSGLDSFAMPVTRETGVAYLTHVCGGGEGRGEGGGGTGRDGTQKGNDEMKKNCRVLLGRVKGTTKQYVDEGMYNLEVRNTTD